MDQEMTGSGFEMSRRDQQLKCPENDRKRSELARKLL